MTTMPSQEKIDISELADLARLGKSDEVKKWILLDKSLLKKKDDSGRILLHWSTSGGHLYLVQFLVSLDQDQDLDVQDGMGWTPLMIAASAGYIPLVRYFLENNCNPKTKTNKGQTALHYAASKNHAEICKLLLDVGADANARDTYGNTPLHRAASQGHIRIVHLLFSEKKYKCMPNIGDSDQNTALHMAVEEGRREIALDLVRKYGADPTRPNKEETTPYNLADPSLIKEMEQAMEERDK